MCHHSENIGKKISFKDLMEFKREIFKSRLSIDIKKESTQKLEEYLANEESTLNARISDMESDHAWIRHYIKMLGDELIRLVAEGKELEYKRQGMNKDMSKIKNEVFRIEVEIGEVGDNIKIYESFRDFVMLVIKAGAYKKYEQAREDLEKKLAERIKGISKEDKEKIKKANTKKFEETLYPSGSGKPKKPDVKEETQAGGFFMTNPAQVPQEKNKTDEDSRKSLHKNMSSSIFDGTQSNILKEHLNIDECNIDEMIDYIS